MPEPSDNSDEPKSGSIQFSFDPSRVGLECSSVKQSSTSALNTSGSQPKRGRSRPRKSEAPSTSQPKIPAKRGSGCPQKSDATSRPPKTPAKRGRGRPPKSQATGSRQPVTSEAPCKCCRKSMYRYQESQW